MSEPEIKPCPVDSGKCGCKVSGRAWFVFCSTCSYVYCPNSEINDDKAALIAAHNALYERARVGELVESLMAGDHDLVAVGCARIIAKDAVIFSAKRHNYLGVDLHEDGPTLLAALEQLAEKVRGA